MNEISNLSEEIFCLKYELDTLAGVAIRSESERWVPGFLHDRTEHSHTARYQLACRESGGKKVIDVACGVGRGSYLLATEGNAKSVDGFDIQPNAVRYASWRNAHSNVKYAVNNAEALGIVNEYDLAVSFETVEHLPNYRNFLISIKQCLKPGGLFLISTPISSISVDHKPVNPYHVQEWGFTEFQNVLKEFFSIEKVYVQLYPKLPAPPPPQPPASSNILGRILKKIKRKLDGPVTQPQQEVYDSNGFSKIEEFTGQYPESELGSLWTGYQIVLAKVKPL